MISTAIRTAVPRNWGSHHGCRAATGGCGGADAVKRYAKRRAVAEEAAQGVAEAGEEAEVPRPPARVCVDCGTSETPLWRSGPEGPKSLCNACGIKYRKRRRALGETHGMLSASPSKDEVGEVLNTEELKRRQREKQERMLKLLVLQHQQQRRSKMEEKAAAEAGKEVEEAALLLMSLSSGLFVHS